MKGHLWGYKMGGHMNVRLTTKLLSMILAIVCFFLPNILYAGVKEEYEEAYKLYVAAGACLAAYSDRQGKLVYDYLEQENWTITPYKETSIKADARFLLAKKRLEPEEQTLYLLAVVGTESMKDIKTDLRVDKVYFAGKTPEEFAVCADMQDIPNSAPKVHRGFHQYVQAALTAETQEGSGDNKKRLSDLLLLNKDRKIYLVGHSLGGAAATIGGARLLSMGVRPEQIEVITFGAPAVGNEAFCQQFGPVLHLTRVVIAGDRVTGVLQNLVGGYKQFGKEIRWEMPITNQEEPHKMTEYLDFAIKNYYLKRENAVQIGMIELPSTVVPEGGKDLTYVAPVKNCLPARLNNEFWYMQQALWDEYRRVLPGYVFTNGLASLDDYKQQALKAGCKWLIVPEVSGYRVKNEPNTYYITLQQIIYDTTTGSVFRMDSFSASTYQLSPLEALAHDATSMNRKGNHEAKSINFR